MKISLMAFFIVLLVATPLYAADVFSQVDLKDIHVVATSPDEARAVIGDRSGNQAEISMGDRVGIDQGTVAEISQAFVIIETENKRIRLPARQGFGKSVQP